MIAGIIIPRVILNAYGSETNGLLVSITQIISYFVLLEAGIAGAAVYSLYKPLAEDDWDKINGIVSGAKISYNKIGKIFLLLTVLFALIYPVLISSSVLSYIEISLLVVIIGFSGAIEFFSLAKYRVILTASQRNYIIAIGTIISTITNIIIIVLFTKLNFSIVFVKGFAISSIIIRSLILRYYVKRKFDKLQFKTKPDKSGLEKRWDAGYVQILFAIQSGLPILLTTFFTNLITVSIFSIYNLVFAALMSIMSIIVVSTYASFGNLIASGDKDRVKEVYKELQFVFYTFLSIVYSITIIMIFDFIKIYVSNVSDGHLYIRYMFGILFFTSSLFLNMQTPQGIMSTAAGLYKEVKVHTTIHLIILVVFGSIFVVFFSIEGIVFVNIVANIYRLIYYIFFVNKNIVSKSIAYTVRQIVKILVVVISTIIFDSLVGIAVSSVATWIFKATLIGIFAILFSLAYSYIFERSDLKILFNRIYRIIK